MTTFLVPLEFQIDLDPSGEGATSEEDARQLLLTHLTQIIENASGDGELSRDENFAVTSWVLGPVAPMTMPLDQGTWELLKQMCEWGFEALPGSADANITLVTDGLETAKPDEIQQHLFKLLVLATKQIFLAQTGDQPAIAVDPECSSGSDMMLVNGSAWVKLAGGETLFISDAKPSLRVEFRYAQTAADDTPDETMVVVHDDDSEDVATVLNRGDF